MEELKQSYLTRKMDERGESPSYEELAEADSTISDEEIYAEYDGTEFSPDDFMCSAGNLQEVVEAWVMEGCKGKYLHINATEDGNGTWFDWTESIWEAYWDKNLDSLKTIAETEFTEFVRGYPKFHKIRFTATTLESEED
jgi:hypothetical protein